MTGPDALTRSVLADQVKERLLESILDGSYPPDARIVETAVAKELGTSQAPVREALRGLEALGIVEITPFRGARVRRLDPQELLEAYVVRSTIEVLGARLAVARLTDEDIAGMLGDRRAHAARRRSPATGGPSRSSTPACTSRSWSCRGTGRCCGSGGRWSRSRAPTSRWPARAPTRSGAPTCTTRCSTPIREPGHRGPRAGDREPLRRGAAPGWPPTWPRARRAAGHRATGHRGPMRPFAYARPGSLAEVYDRLDDVDPSAVRHDRRAAPT